MTETIIIEGEEESEGSELAEAAVAAAAVSGAAHAAAEHATADAEEAEAKANVAFDIARDAHLVASTAFAEKPDRGEVESMIDSRLDALVEALTARLAKTEETEQPNMEEEPPPDTPPSNLEKKKKKTFAERYLGIDS